MHSGHTFWCELSAMLILRCGHGRLQERIGSDCIVLLQAVTAALSDCCTKMGLGTPAKAAQRARPPPRWELLQLGERCTCLQMTAQSLLTCMQHRILCLDSPNEQRLPGALGPLIPQVTYAPACVAPVFPGAAACWSCSPVMCSRQHQQVAPGAVPVARASGPYQNLSREVSPAHCAACGLRRGGGAHSCGWGAARGFRRARPGLPTWTARPAEPDPPHHG